MKNYLPEPYSKWKHFKGEEYIVSDIALNTKTEELDVVYFKETYDGKEPFRLIRLTFTRPLKEWEEFVPNIDGFMKARFEQVE